MSTVHPACQPHPRLRFADFWRVLVRFWPFVNRYRGKFVLGILLILVAVPLGQFSVFLTRDATNRIFLASEETIEARWTGVLAIVGLQACFWLVSSLLSTAREVLEWYVSMRSTYDLRMAFYRHLYRLPLSFLLQRPPGEHVYRATEDIGPRDGDGYAPGLMGMIARMIPQLFEAVYGVIWGGILLFLIDPGLAFMLALYIVPFAVCAHLMYDKLRLSSFAFRATSEQESAVLRDSVAGLRSIKGAGRTLLQRRIYGRIAGDSKRLQNQLSFQTILTTQGVVWSFRWAFQLIVFVFMTHRVISGQATLGDWVASFLIVTEAQTPLEKAVQIVQQIRMQIVPGQRVLETLDVQPTHADPPNAVQLPPLQGSIDFDQVHFSYLSGIPVLKGVSFQIQPNSHLGIVGPSGAGKSSLVGLFLRQYVPESGWVRVDGKDIQQIQLNSLLDQCAVVPQSTYLYEGTIRENILFGNKDATDAELTEACRQSGVLEFAERFPDGIDTWIGEGALLSGGERQRIGIARALIRNPRIVILDEATASLDSETEEEILQCLQIAFAKQTVITIAHRLKAVAECDSIVVLNFGQVTQQGTHKELIEQDGLYRDLWQEQAASADLQEPHHA
jgi:subfamily B ATP-binding cassette protein MsbA